MPAIDQDLELYQNATEVIIIAVTDESNVPLDLTTFTDLCWVMTKGGVEVLRYELADIEMDIVNADGTDDGIRLTIPSATTALLSCGRIYTHQAWGVFGGATKPLSVGYVTVMRGDGC